METVYHYIRHMKTLFANERRIRLIGIPLVSVTFMLIYNYDELTSLAAAIESLFISFVFTFVLWEGNRAIVLRLRRRYRRSEQTTQRLTVQTVANVVFTVGSTLLIYYIFELFGVVICESPSEKMISVVVNLVPMSFVVSVYEGAYSFDEWVKNLQRSEALAKENIRSQFEALKNQLDPHFLFNSMNTLAALIDEYNEPAQKYLEQLSDVYRYVLMSKQKETVPLHEEWAFVESYIYLNKARFRDNLIVHNELSESAMQQLVPPLSLQLLVENAIKHNVVSKDRPLTLRLSIDAHGYITVENNVQKKNILEKSTKTGLQNMINRYALLTDERVEVLQTADVFSVKIPTLAS